MVDRLQIVSCVERPDGMTEADELAWALAKAALRRYLTPPNSVRRSHAQ